MHLSIYVGPYFVVPANFPWFDFDQLVADGRMEAKRDGELLILVPNCPLPGVERQMVFSRDDECDVVPIERVNVISECNAFATAAIEVVSYCNRKQIEIHARWGVVPCWS
jgi:hypothetical protein